MYVSMCTYVFIFISSPEVKAPAPPMPPAPDNYIVLLSA